MPRVVVLVLWVVAGACWLLALFLPWTTHGALSSATLVEAMRLVRRGTVDEIVPSGAAAALLVPALAGIVLIGLAGFHGRAVAVTRTVAGVVGTLASVALGIALAGADPGAAGPGVWVTLIGVLVVVAAIVATVVRGLGGFGPPTAGKD